MAQNPFPDPPGALAILAGKCAQSLNTYAAPLDITQVSAAGLQAETTTLNAACGAFNAARAARTKAYVPLNAASAAAKKFISDGRGLLVSAWGETYTVQWAEAGWTDHSTSVPDTLPGRLSFVTALKGFLTTDPSYETATKTITFTAKQADVVEDALEAVLTGVDTADTADTADTDATDATDAKTDRTTADTALRGDLRVLIGILTKKLTPNDSRWVSFGLNAPGAAVTPKAPTDLQSHPALPGQLYATCTMPPCTAHLRGFLLPSKINPVSRVVDTADGELLLTGLPSGETVELQVTAVNTAGESVPSAPISVTVA